MVTNQCDLAELRHQVKEKALAELKEYVASGQGWSKPETDYVDWWVKALGNKNLAVNRLRTEKVVIYTLRYKGIDVSSRCLSLSKDSDWRASKGEGRGLLKTMMDAYHWHDTRETCIKYQRALGIKTEDTPHLIDITPFENAAVQRTNKAWSVVLGGLAILALIIGISLI